MTMVHQSVADHQWEQHRTSPGSIPPSIHSDPYLDGDIEEVVAAANEDLNTFHVVGKRPPVRTQFGLALAARLGSDDDRRLYWRSRDYVEDYERLDHLTKVSRSASEDDSAAAAAERHRAMISSAESSMVVFFDGLSEDESWDRDICRLLETCVARQNLGVFTVLAYSSAHDVGTGSRPRRLLAALQGRSRVLDCG